MGLTGRRKLTFSLREPALGPAARGRGAAEGWRAARGRGLARGGRAGPRQGLRRAARPQPQPSHRPAGAGRGTVSQSRGLEPHGRGRPESCSTGIRRRGRVALRTSTSPEGGKVGWDPRVSVTGRARRTCSATPSALPGLSGVRCGAL